MIGASLSLKQLALPLSDVVSAFKLNREKVYSWVCKWKQSFKLMFHSTGQPVIQERSKLLHCCDYQTAHKSRCPQAVNRKAANCNPNKSKHTSNSEPRSKCLIYTVSASDTRLTCKRKQHFLDSLRCEHYHKSKTHCSWLKNQFPLFICAYSLTFFLDVKKVSSLI